MEKDRLRPRQVRYQAAVRPGYLTYGTDAANILSRGQRAAPAPPVEDLHHQQGPEGVGALCMMRISDAIIDRVLERGRLIRRDGPSIRNAAPEA